MKSWIVHCEESLEWNRIVANSEAEAAEYAEQSVDDDDYDDTWKSTYLVWPEPSDWEGDFPDDPDSCPKDWPKPVGIEVAVRRTIRYDYRTRIVKK